MKWISVKERLPKSTGWYLCLRMPVNLPVTECFIKDKNNWKYTAITHWINLPNPPICGKCGNTGISPVGDIK